MKSAVRTVYLGKRNIVFVTVVLFRAVSCNYHLYHHSIRARRKMVYKAVSTNQSSFTIRTEGRPVRKAAAHNISGIASHLKNRLYPYTSHTKKNGGSFFFTFPHILLIPFEHYGKLFGRIMKGK